MKSLSYIIILMSLIGNSQSGKAFCVENKLSFCSEKSVDKVFNEDAKQLLKDFGHFISKYNQKFKKQHVFVESSSKTISFPQPKNQFENWSFDEVSKIQKKTSKVRNKDDLEIRFLA